MTTAIPPIRSPRSPRFWSVIQCLRLNEARINAAYSRRHEPHGGSAMRLRISTTFLALWCCIGDTAAADSPGLWSVYDSTLVRAKYIDLTHTITPDAPVWHGFRPSKFAQTTNPETGHTYTYANDGFEAR